MNHAGNHYLGRTLLVTFSHATLPTFDRRRDLCDGMPGEMDLSNGLISVRIRKRIQDECSAEFFLPHPLHLDVVLGCSEHSHGIRNACRGPYKISKLPTRTLRRIGRKAHVLERKSGLPSLTVHIVFSDFPKLLFISWFSISRQ